MKLHSYLKTVVCFVLFTGTAWSFDIDGRPLDVELDATFVSKYMSRGYDELDGDGAFQPSVHFDLFETGFSLNVWGSFALTSGHENADELNYTLAWNHTFFEEDPFALEFQINYIYLDYPNTDSRSNDYQELGAQLALPNLIPLGPSFLVPSYEAAYNWPVHSQGPDHGWFHVFALGYDLPFTPLLKEQEEQALCFSADLTWNDGAFDSEAGWSHATVGLSTSFEWRHFTLTPAVSYQWSFEDTVNEENEFWASISLTYSF